MSKKDRKTHDNDKFELENQFIIRFPKDLGDEVRKAVEIGNIHKKLSISLDSELRYGEVRINNEILHAKVVDLPTIVESYKTEDKLNLYKTADISQMMICSREILKDRLKITSRLHVKELERFLSSEVEDDKENKSQKRVPRKDIPKVDETFLWPHGITPPNRKLRKRRITNAMQGKNIEPKDKNVLKDLKKLLRSDCEAISVEYDIVQDELVSEKAVPLEEVQIDDIEMIDSKSDEKETEVKGSDEELEEIIRKLF